MQIRWLGHSGFCITGSKTVVIDPFLSDNPVAPHGPDGITSCDVLLLTHDHFDHVADVETILESTGATFVGIHELAVKFGEVATVAEGMNIGGSIETNGIKVHMVNAVHSSTLGKECGMIFELDGKTIYHLGDTGLFGDLELYSRFFSVDVAMVPIGDRYTMGPESAAEAVRMIKCKQVIPIHYNTWPPIAQDPNHFKELVGDAAEVIVLDPGDSHEL